MLKEFERPDDGMTKEERKAETKRLQGMLSARQQEIRNAKLPVIVLVEGWDAAGKGTLINELISEVDPRFLTMVSEDSQEQKGEYPFLYPYAAALPEEGKLLFMDGGWMGATVQAQMRDELSGKALEKRLRSVQRFERQLRDNGYVLLKLFLHIPRKLQQARIDRLLEDKDTAWRVEKDDLYQNHHYKGYRAAFEQFMAATEEVFPWHVLDGSDEKTVSYDAFRLLNETIDEALKAGKYVGAPFEEAFPMAPAARLADADLSAALTKDEYEEEKDRLQKKIAELQNVMYRKKIPMVICYEGWDAAGKGGNIRRLAYPLDPRGFTTWPIASPEPHEKSRHYLWRFWTRLPKAGHIAIFDRTWYGRVMVERIEGFCSEDDWKRAYNEMNEFEEELHDWGAVVLKFWIHIDSETQLARFNDRQNDPAKQWKITDEDWRNREKWPKYEEAVSEMLEKTGTEFAPWHIIESNDKYYARVKVLRIVAEAMEQAIREREG